jgi:hypothetical protein
MTTFVNDRDNLFTTPLVVQVALSVGGEEERGPGPKNERKVAKNEPKAAPQKAPVVEPIRRSRRMQEK